MPRTASMTKQGTKRSSRANVRGDVQVSLSLAQMKARYKNEWILVKDPVVDAEMRVLRGAVVCHSKDRSDVYRKAVDLGLKHTAFIYTGRIARDAAIIL